jgi:hypothetical protein
MNYPYEIMDAYEDETRRETVRRAVALHGQRLLAALVGVSRSALRKYLAMHDTGTEIRERIYEWCKDRPEPDVPPGTVALLLLAREYPPARRADARRRIAALLTELHTEAGVDARRWLLDEA